MQLIRSIPVNITVVLWVSNLARWSRSSVYLFPERGVLVAREQQSETVNQYRVAGITREVERCKDHFETQDDDIDENPANENLPWV